jgi:hypothetical protein
MNNNKKMRQAHEEEHRMTSKYIVGLGKQM